MLTKKKMFYNFDTRIDFDWSFLPKKTEGLLTMLSNFFCRWCWGENKLERWSVSSFFSLVEYLRAGIGARTSGAPQPPSSCYLLTLYTDWMNFMYRNALAYQQHGEKGFITLAPVANVIKTFCPFTNFCNKLECFSCMFFQSSLIFACKAGAYPSKAHFRCSTRGKLLALPQNIRPCWKLLLDTNTLAYYENL